MSYILHEIVEQIEISQLQLHTNWRTLHNNVSSEQQTTKTSQSLKTWILLNQVSFSSILAKEQNSTLKHCVFGQLMSLILKKRLVFLIFNSK